MVLTKSASDHSATLSSSVATVNVMGVRQLASLKGTTRVKPSFSASALIRTTCPYRDLTATNTSAVLVGAGLRVGAGLGSGLTVGDAVLEGACVGGSDGVVVGAKLGGSVGGGVGRMEGVPVGCGEGTSEGLRVGA